MRLLFVRLRSLGDTVLMTPAIEVAGRAGYEVAVAVEEPFDRILRENPWVSRILTPGGGPKLWGRLRLASRIRAFRPEVAVDLHGGSTAAWLTRASGARLRVGYGSSRLAFLYNHRVGDAAQLWGAAEIHTVQHQLSPLKSLGLGVEPIPPLCLPLDEHAAVWAGHWHERHRPARPFVLIHLAAAFDTKRWALENFVGLARTLAAEGCGVGVTAGPGQEDLLERFAASPAAAAAVVVAPLPLERFAALAATCDLYVGNDTGPTHVAAALERPVVVIFGSSDAKVWRPWGTPYRLLQAELDCIPCPGYYCLHYDEPKCIRSIGVQPVVEAARELLELQDKPLTDSR